RAHRARARGADAAVADASDRSQGFRLRRRAEAPAARDEEMTTESAAARITREVSNWPGVTVTPHRFGGVEFRVGRRELGHLHGNRLADLPFPRSVREELVASGRAQTHHVLPESGWVSFPIRT